MARETHHIVPNPNGGWDIKRGGGKKTIKHCDTKDEAVKIGREISKNQETEFLIHGKDGKIKVANSHGNDPRGTKG